MYQLKSKNQTFKHIFLRYIGQVGNEGIKGDIGKKGDKGEIGNGIPGAVRPKGEKGINGWYHQLFFFNYGSIFYRLQEP